MTDRQTIMCFPLPTDNVGISRIALSLYRELRNQGRPVSFITPVVRRHAFDLGVRQAVPWGLRMLPWRHLRRLAGFHYRRAILGAIRPADHVVLLGHREKAHHIYDEVDAFVFPSLEEGGPLVTYEAMGHGLPVIVSPMGAGAVAQAGLNGIVSPPQHAPS